MKEKMETLDFFRKKFEEVDNTKINGFEYENDKFFFKMLKYEIEKAIENGQEELMETIIAEILEDKSVTKKIMNLCKPEQDGVKI